MAAERCPVLITGCSSGIGRATARYLLNRDYPVYATARDETSLRELADAGAHTDRLDVTDEASMAKVVARVESDHGRVGALVNNAGYAEFGPVETVPLDRAIRQYETNFFGMARMCQLVLPGMRRAGGGHIVNMSSVGGKVTFPGGGFYDSSKHAIESLSDALRFEVAPFGVKVVVIEPNLVHDTGFGAGIEESLARNTDENGPYRDFLRALTDQMNLRFTARKMSSSPERVAATVHRAITDRRPRARYVVSNNGKFLIGFGKLLPDRTLDGFLRKQFGLTESGHYTGRNTPKQPT